MPFIPGQSGNPNGKPKGAKNKVDSDLRQMISAFLNKEFNTVKKEFKSLQPKDKLKFYTELLQYGLPKLQSTTLEFDFDSLSEEQLDEIINKLTAKANES